MINQDFQGNRLTQALSITGIKKRDLAEYCDIPMSTISRYENGSLRPSFEMVKLIARYLRVKEDFFYKPEPQLYIGNVSAILH